MAALRAGREKLGEKEGVPAGASCAVASDGRVTIMDPVAQRSYLLVPEGGQSFAPSRPPTGPRFPGESEPPAPHQDPHYGTTPLGAKSAKDIAEKGVTTASTKSVFQTARS
ncbi:MAG: hypothetical protein KC416_17640, partial [Myxococcales bacterium]|nr:hypothetical protein [Myxococcales bacterium]